MPVQNTGRVDASRDISAYLDPAVVDRELESRRSPASSTDGVDAGGAAGAGFDDQVAFNGKPVLFLKGKGDKNEIDFDDVNQEGLSDCYLLAPLASLAKEDPGAIKNMIKAKKDGTYDVTLYKRDAAGTLKPHVENVDPRQFSVGASGPGDVSGNKKEIWAMVVEKAFAQMNGGYNAIGNGGNWEYGMETLTGRESHTHDSATLPFADVEKALKKNQPVVINTLRASTAEHTAALTSLNLVGWHSYSIVDSKKDKGDEWVKLSNPWGNNHPGASAADRKDDGGWIRYSDLVASGILQGTAIGEGTRPIRG